MGAEQAKWAAAVLVERIRREDRAKNFRRRANVTEKQN